MKKKKCNLIIDGHNYLYRAYYGIPAKVLLPSGQKGNAVYGFLAFLRRMVQWLEPKNVVVVFDSETGIDCKQREFAEYKSNRKATDEDMWKQMEIIQEVLRFLDIPIIEDSQNEADDVIGTLAGKEYFEENSFISSGDNDFLQLVSPSVRIAREIRGKLTIIDEDFVAKKLNILSSQYADYIALKGDPSDNISGLKGIGKVTARGLLRDFGDVPRIIRNNHKLPIKLSKLICENKNYLLRMRKFLEINKDVDISGYMDDMKLYNRELLLLKTNEIFRKVGKVFK